MVYSWVSGILVNHIQVRQYKDVHVPMSHPLAPCSAGKGSWVKAYLVFGYYGTEGEGGPLTALPYYVPYEGNQDCTRYLPIFYMYVGNHISLVFPISVKGTVLFGFEKASSVGFGSNFGQLGKLMIVQDGMELKVHPMK
jgi:hypothetical protein